MNNHQVLVPVLLSRQEVCELLHCSLGTLSRLGIPQVKIRRRCYYKAETVTDWITANEQPKSILNQNTK